MLTLTVICLFAAFHIGPAFGTTDWMWLLCGLLLIEVMIDGVAEWVHRKRER